MTRGRVLCIVGPTASGKSALAELVALELAGEIVSIDAMQVYRGMDIGTAKTPKDERRCPLHMIDVVVPSADYSVSLFQVDARHCIDELIGKSIVPVLCGGTGLYLDAVIDEMQFPRGDQCGETRARYESMAKRCGSKALHDLLRTRDEESAALIHPNNVRRVVRALEMLDEGVSYADTHKGLRTREKHYDARIWGIDTNRDVLYERIDNRVDRMFNDGLVDEVSRLLDNGLRESSTASQAIGYKEVTRALDGEITFNEAKTLVKRNSRRYAKRQISWLKRDGRVRWLNSGEITQAQMMRCICDDWRMT